MRRNQRTSSLYMGRGFERRPHPSKNSQFTKIKDKEKKTRRGGRAPNRPEPSTWTWNQEISPRGQVNGRNDFHNFNEHQPVAHEQPMNHFINTTTSPYDQHVPIKREIIPLMSLPLPPIMPYSNFNSPPPTNNTNNHHQHFEQRPTTPFRRDYIPLIRTPPPSRQNSKRYFDDFEDNTFYNNINVDNTQRNIKLEKRTPTPEPAVIEASPEVIALSPEPPIFDVEDEKDDSTSLLEELHQNQTIDAEVSEVEEPVVASKKTKKKVTRADKSKEKKTRRKANACEICDVQGHNEMQCQMICRNCKEKYHNSGKCPNPMQPHNMLTTFLDFSIKQFMLQQQINKI